LAIRGLQVAVLALLLLSGAASASGIRVGFVNRAATASSSG
jgi:hypothetical protein